MGQRGSRRAAVAATVAVGLLALAPIAGLFFGARETPGGLLPPSPSDGLGSLLLGADVWRLIGNTAVLAASCTALAVVIGTVLAWLEHRTAYPGRRALGLLSALPLAIPSYLVAATLREALGPGGMIGSPLGLPPFTGLLPAIVVLTLVNTPYVQILVGSALMRTSAAEEEAAAGLGASGWRRFCRITLPALRPAIALGGTLVVLYVVSDFGAVAVLDCQVLTWRMFQAYESQQVTRAAALGLGALLLIAPVVVAGTYLQGRAGAWQGAANPRRVLPRRPGRPVAAVVTALQGVWILLGVALPLFTLGGWVVVGALRGERFADPGGALLSTLLLGVTGGLLIMLLATAPAWVAVRRRRPWGWLVDQAVFLSGALPGVLVAFGLISLVLSAQVLALGPETYVRLRQLAVLLFLGYSVKFLSQGFSGLKAAIHRLDRRQDEAARSLGATGWRLWRHVRLPALAPGIAAGYLLLFLVLIKELPITLMLQPIGIQTLSFRIYDRYQEAFLHDAGLAGVLLVAVALLGQWATRRWRRHV